MTEEKFATLFGLRLREARKTLGMGQAELAARAGVSREQWGLYERGLSVPGCQVMALAAGAGVDVRYVVTGARDYDPPPALTVEEQVLLGYFRSASPPVRKAALGALVGAQPSSSPAVVVRGSVGHTVVGDQFNVIKPGGAFIDMGGKRKR